MRFLLTTVMAFTFSSVALAAPSEICTKINTQGLMSRYAEQKCGVKTDVLRSKLRVIYARNQCDSQVPDGGMPAFTEKTNATLDGMQKSMGTQTFCSSMEKYLDGLGVGIDISTTQVW